MKSTFEDLLPGVPPQEGNGGKLLKPSVSDVKVTNSEPVTPIDKTTKNAKRVLEEDAEVRAEKTARLKAAREERDARRMD